MNKDSIKEFFKPHWKKWVIVGVLILIAYAGFIQAWGFSKESKQKPLLYFIYFYVLSCLSVFIFEKRN